MNDRKLINIDFLSLVKSKLSTEFGYIISDLVLFGSRVSGMNSEYSDFDLLIILNTQYDWKLKDRITELLVDIEIEYNILIDTHIISTFELQNTLRGAEPIYQNAIKSGVHA